MTIFRLIGSKTESVKECGGHSIRNLCPPRMHFLDEMDQKLKLHIPFSNSTKDIEGAIDRVAFLTSAVGMRTSRCFSNGIWHAEFCSNRTSDHDCHPVEVILLITAFPL